MADQLNMQGMSLQDSQHAPQHGYERGAYIPPHMRQTGGRPPMNGPPAGANGGYPPPGPAPPNGGG